MTERFVRCLCLAGLFYLGPWVDLAKGAFFYLFRGNPVEQVLAPVIVGHLAMAALLFLLAPVALRLPRLLLILPGTCLFLWSIHEMLDHSFDFWVRVLFVSPVTLGAVALLLLASLYCGWRHGEKVLRFYSALLLIAGFPLAILVFNSFYQVTRVSSERFRDRPPLPFEPQGKPAPMRIIWVIFDEMSYTMLRDLPNFARLRQESFNATNAQAPGEHTKLSLPALTTGSEVVEANPLGPDDLVLKSPDGSERRWSQLPNIFNDARQWFSSQGIAAKIGVAGWYNPYGRIFGHRLQEYYVTGYSSPDGAPEVPMSPGFASLTYNLWEGRLRSLAALFRIPGIDPDGQLRRRRAENFDYLRAHSLRMAADAQFGLLLIHLPIPHPPAVSTDGSRLASNLALTDHMLGDLYKAADLSRTVLIVSSDHPMRHFLWRLFREHFHNDEMDFIGAHQDKRIPFFVRLPGAAGSHEYTKPLATIYTRALINGVLRGELADYSALAAWFDQTTASRPGPPTSP